MATFVLATAVMGLVLIAVALFVAYGIEWRSASIFSSSPADHRAGGALGAFLGHPAVWVSAFVVLALGLAGVVLAAVGAVDVALPGGDLAAAGAFVFLIALFLLGGTYAAVRDRGRTYAEAVGASLAVVGFLLVAAVLARLAGLFG